MYNVTANKFWEGYRLKITRLRTNHFTNPLGFWLKKLAFSWVVAESTGKRQQAARIEIAGEEAFADVLYDSGWQEGISSLGYHPDFLPEAGRRYYGRVSVRADDGDSGVSAPAWFETARPFPENAQWITPGFSPEVHPVIQKKFCIPEVCTRARAYICGLGVYELYINGKKAGEEYLTPGIHAYDSWLQYQTYDLTTLLVSGENTITVLLGNGWYKGRYRFGNPQGNTYGSRFALICAVDLDCMDGSHKELVTDESWQCHESPVLLSDIYDGERYDANREAALAESGGWSPARRLPWDQKKLTPRLSLPVVIKHRLPPVEVLHTPAGETVLDFGQEVTGWVEFEAHAAKGAVLTLEYGELLLEGCFFRDNLRTAQAKFAWISNGQAQHVRPHFTFYGFRYVRLSGFPAPVDPADFTACVLYSDLEQTGFLETGDAKVNRLIQNTIWGQRGNFLDLPTDCPQRDERMGWTGDAQVFCAAACFHMDCAAFYTKYLYDMRLEQLLLDGSIPHIVPVPKNEDGSTITDTASCAWADAATIMPWTVYQFYGDKALLCEQYPLMKGWVDYLEREDQKNGGKRLWLNGGHYGDWLSLDNFLHPDSAGGGTDETYLATAYYAYSAALTARAAQALDLWEDAAYYTRLASEVRQAFCREFFTETGRCAVPTQTAYVVALHMELIPQEFRPRVLRALHELLEEDDIHLRTGFIGTAYLCRVLTENGLHEDACRLLLNQDFPSWLYEVNHGATTIWERWNAIPPNGETVNISMNSMNHYAYGAIAEWMYRDLCGLQPEAPGFQSIRIAPHPCGKLQFAKASYDSASGRYECGWRIQPDGVILYEITVPFGCRARLCLPGNGTLCINGATVSRNADELVLEAGRYRITAHTD